MDKSFGSLWAATTRFLAENGTLLLPLAAAFLFLPQLLLSFGMRDIPADATSIPEDMRFRFTLLLALVISFSVIGQLTVAQMVLGSGHSLGELLKKSLILFVPALAASLMQSIAIGFGLLLLLIPGLYLIGRLVLVVPVIADGERDPVQALKRSWKLTQGEGFRVLFMVLGLLLAMLVVVLLMSGIGAAMGVVTAVTVGQPDEGWGIGSWLFEMASSAVSALTGLCYMIFIAHLYRSLRV